jgi:hypothetical protein
MEPVSVMQVTQIYEIYRPLVTRQYYSPRAKRGNTSAQKVGQLVEVVERRTARCRVSQPG